MKIKKLPSNKKIVVIVSVILVATIGYGAYAASSQQWPFTSNEAATSGSATQASSTDDNPQGGTPTTEPDPADTPETSPKTPVQNEAPADTPQNSVDVTLTSVTTIDDSVRIKSLIEAITNTGSCTLTFTKGNMIVTKSSGIQALPNSSTCKGFTVPKNELASGVWHITLSVTTGGKTGSANKDYKVE